MNLKEKGQSSGPLSRILALFPGEAGEERWDHEPWVAGKSPRTQMVVEHRTGLRMKVVLHFLWVEREATGAGEGAQAW